MTSDLHRKLLELLATLRAIKWHAWNLHWKAAGPNAYSDHLLFERIYAGSDDSLKIDDQIDGLGERITALFGGQGINGPRLTEMSARIHKAVAGMTMVAGALELEQKALKLTAAIADRVSKGAPQLRVSLDNFVRELADARSTVIYLLKQRLGRAVANYGEMTMFEPVKEMSPIKAAICFGITTGLAGYVVGDTTGNKPNNKTILTYGAFGAVAGYFIGKKNEEEAALEAEAQPNGVYSLERQYGTLADAALFEDEDTKKKLMIGAGVLAALYFAKQRGMI
jgi:DNA-binding ferritin-like protein